MAGHSALPAPYMTNGERRGGRVLINDGYRYCRSNSSSARERIYWRCARPNCGETLVTNFFDVALDEPADIQIIHCGGLLEHTHAHEPDFNIVERRQFVEEAFAVIRQDPSLTIKRAYDIVVSRGNYAPPEIPAFDSIRSQLQRLRATLCRTRPPIPRDIADRDGTGVWSESWNGDRRLLLLENAAAGVAVFATNEELRAPPASIRDKKFIVMSKRKSKQPLKLESGDAPGDSTTAKKARSLDKNTESNNTQDLVQGQGNHGNHDPKLADFTSPADAFARIIHPMKIETFMDEYWEKQPLILSNREGHGEYFRSLFTRTILEGLVAEQKISFIQDCNVCRYKGGVRESLNGEGILKPNKLKELLDKSKATIQFHQPQRFQESVWKLLEHMESYFGCLVGSNVYMTPQLSQGLAPHYDDVEVFVLQLEGEKHWRLYKPPTPLPRDYSRDLDQSEIGEPTHDIVLKAGDLMYFPRGTVHQADTPDTCSHSTHLTISTYQRSAWGDLLSIALPSIIQTAISDNVSYRQGFPLRFVSDPSHQASSTETGKKMADLISQLSGHIGSHGQEAANEMLCDFIANRLPPYCEGETDFDPSGPMPSSDQVQVRFRFPDHTFIVRRQGDDDEEEEDDEDEEEDEDEDDLEYQLFVYHSLHNSHQEHMMSSEPKEALGVQLPKECEPALRTLQECPQTWRNVTDISLEDTVRLQMVMSLWAEGLLDVRETSS